MACSRLPLCMRRWHPPLSHARGEVTLSEHGFCSLDVHQVVLCARQARWGYPYDKIGENGLGSWGSTYPQGARMIDFNYPAVLDAFPQHVDPKRSESASFLIWYLENYYRLDTLEAVDAVCDQKRGQRR